MSQDLRNRIYGELDSLVLVDPHTHINALDPASHTLADILGYHYYTELAHSAGMPKDQIEEPGIDPKEKVGRLIENLGPIDNTIQYSWFVEMAQAFFGFDDELITKDNWEPLYDRAVQEMAADDWADTVMSRSKLESVFLTNDFDDRLEGFDTKKYVPCLRTDDLVFHLSKREVQERLTGAAGAAVGDAETLKYAIGKLFEHFAANGARACAISLPPDFSPMQIPTGRANTAISSIYALGPDASDADKKAAANFVFWTLAEYCADFCLPFDLMIGVNRGVYEGGVYQGQDLYDSRVSLIQYGELFNAFPQVTFPISVLASVTSQELASYAWIFPNVVTNGHWWYSNTPTFIEHDAAARLEAVPRTKQIGYYSDMYKLEFALPKFNMYKRILAKILAERYVVDRRWSEERAVEFGKQILRDNVESVFRLNEEPVVKTIAPPQPAESAADFAPFSPDLDASQTDQVDQPQLAGMPTLDLDGPIDGVPFDGTPQVATDEQPAAEQSQSAANELAFPTFGDESAPTDSAPDDAGPAEDIFSQEFAPPGAAAIPQSADRPIETAAAEEVQPAISLPDQFDLGQPVAGQQDVPDPLDDEIMDLIDDTEPDDTEPDDTEPDEPGSLIEQPIFPTAEQPIFPTVEQPQPVMASPADPTDDIVDDIFVDDDVAPPNTALTDPAPIDPAPIDAVAIQANPIEPSAPLDAIPVHNAPLDVAPMEIPNTAPLDFASPKPANPAPNLDAQPQTVAHDNLTSPAADQPPEIMPASPEPATPSMSEVVEDDLSIDDILDDELLPPGFAAPKPQQPVAEQPASAPKPTVPQISVPEIDAGEDDAVEDLTIDELLDDELLPPDFGDAPAEESDATPFDDDEFPGIKI